MNQMTRRLNTFDPISPFRDLVEWVQNEAPLSEMKSFDETVLPVDISEDENSYVVRASLPGFQRDDIDIEVHEGVLTIRAEHEEKTEEQNEKFYRRERRIGSLSRRISLPGIESNGECSAELKDGVLTLRIPQAESRRPRKIEVK